MMKMLQDPATRCGKESVEISRGKDKDRSHDLGGYQYDDEEQGYAEENGDDEDVHIEYEEEQPNYEPIRDEPINVTLNDPRAFDCPICFEPLTIPVFQCDDNGHIACCNCSSKINICPSCCSPFGSSRCRAIEKVLESSTISCRNSKYGCNETMTYDKKREHERACMHLPCSYPHSGCEFVASYRNLNKHFETNHAGSAIRFSYNRDFPITLKKNEKFIVLQERNEGTLFILKNRLIEGVGNAVRLTCLQPSFLKRESFYELGASTNGGNLRLLSYTKSSPNHVYDGSPSMANFLLFPVDFFRSSDQLRMNLCISPNGDQPPIH
uniref:E3 ubiquitin-protein ligase SINA-like 10 n=1 Tax=Fragaria vesca subsp. vesca TaxID=101020 RepID=UPI0005C9F8E1|nr:PREDICTED: E3 ubiquitin-protein ligase SINA-like 10 [Fragaria vesca subsp. vesca]